MGTKPLLLEKPFISSGKIVGPLVMLTLIDGKEKAHYSCAQEDLYQGLRLVWGGFYTNNLPRWTGASTKYDAPYGVTRNGAVEVSEDLPDFQSRYADPKQAGKDVAAARKLCTNDSKSLFTHIENV